VSRYQKGKTDLDFTEARESEWQWHQLGHMQVCTSLQTDNHASTPPLKFLQAGCPSCCPTNSIKALKAHTLTHTDRQGINTMPPAAYRMGGRGIIRQQNADKIAKNKFKNNISKSRHHIQIWFE